MNIHLSGALVYENSGFSRRDIYLSNGIITAIGSQLLPLSSGRRFDLSNCIIIPGLADVHIHLREPGFSYKETVKTGTLAAAAGGYTTVCAMPNLSPPPDSPDNLALELEIIARDACIPVLPYACITLGQKGEGELVDFAALAPMCFGFSDDGKGIQDGELMRRAMLAAKSVGSFIAAHCEDESLLGGGYIHAGAYAQKHGHAGISSESEWAQLKRDLELAHETGCKYHVCHVSTKESVELIRRAKARGTDVSCETAPHYLILCDEDLREDGRFKMNPPLRGKDDREALIDGICDGTIDMIATDHAPHSREEKSRGLAGSAMGVVGLETAFPLMYTHLVKTGIITLEKLVELMALAPRRRFKLPGGQIKTGASADFTVIDLNQQYDIAPEGFQSMGRATPFEGTSVCGRVVQTYSGGECVWQR